MLGRAPFKHHLARLWWNGLPIFIIALLCVPSAIRGFNALFAGAPPLLPVLAVCYWGLRAPERLPYSAVFILGILHDLITGYPPGASPLSWMAAYACCVRLRAYIEDQGFTLWWVICAGAFALAMMVMWLIVSWHSGRAMPLVPALVQYVLTLLLYPIAHLAWHETERRLQRKWWFLLKSV